VKGEGGYRTIPLGPRWRLIIVVDGVVDNYGSGALFSDSFHHLVTWRDLREEPRCGWLRTVRVYGRHGEVARFFITKVLIEY
jgi:hypothetical protein